MREAEKLVKKLKREKNEAEAPEDRGLVINYIGELENRLTKNLGRRVKIVEGKQKGRVELEYYDREDFERLYELLSSLQP